jgi:hypothetical protein
MRKLLGSLFLVILIGFPPLLLVDKLLHHLLYTNANLWKGLFVDAIAVVITPAVGLALLSLGGALFTPEFGFGKKGVAFRKHLAHGECPTLEAILLAQGDARKIEEVYCEAKKLPEEPDMTVREKGAFERSKKQTQFSLRIQFPKKYRVSLEAYLRWCCREGIHLREIEDRGDDNFEVKFVSRRFTLHEPVKG